MKILMYNTKEFRYFEVQGKDFNLIAFSMRELINQLWSVYGFDYRMYLFTVFSPADLGIINYSQLN